jgi:uncharacterized YigZ family protein
VTRYLAPVAPAAAELREKGSRFLARLVPAADEAQAKARLAALAAEHPDATHHCWAWRAWRAGRLESAGHDAGEPAGSAGRPILGALERADLVGAGCVVTRWFGGTKLGTGGLARAYAEAAALAIEAAAAAGALEAVEPAARRRLVFPYERSGPVRGALARFAAVELAGRYGAEVDLTVAVARARAKEFEAAVGDAGAGEVRMEALEDVLIGAPS